MKSLDDKSEDNSRKKGIKGTKIDNMCKLENQSEGKHVTVDSAMRKERT